MAVTSSVSQPSRRYPGADGPDTTAPADHRRRPDAAGPQAPYPFGRCLGIDARSSLRRTAATTGPVPGALAAVATGAGAVALDQATKGWADQHAGTSVLRNADALLGTVGGSATALIVATVAVLVAFGLVVVPIACRLRVPVWVPALVLGGAASNLVDRARLGEVRDFVTTPWAVVNLADLCVIAGVVLLPTLALLRVRSAAPS